jgi:hypothetical protein
VSPITEDQQAGQAKSTSTNCFSHPKNDFLGKIASEPVLRT